MCPKPLTRLDGGGGGRSSSFVVAGSLVPERHGQEHVCALDTFAFVPLDQSLRASEPARGGTEFASDRELHADPECAACGSEHAIRVGVQSAGTLEDLHPLLLVAEHVGGGREQLEVFGLQRRRLLRAGERVVRISPSEPPVCRPAAFELAYVTAGHRYQATGRAARLRKSGTGRHDNSASGMASRNTGRRRSSVVSAISASRRASGAPRQ
jgi:hypothetical protein